MEKIEQTILEVEELSKTIKFKLKKIRKKNKNLHKEKSFVFTVYLERWREENEIDIDLFLELAQEYKIVHNHAPVNKLIEYMEHLTNVFLRMVFSLQTAKERLTPLNFFRIAEFVGKVIDRNDDPPNVCYASDIFR